jgi:hypothetical protein
MGKKSLDSHDSHRLWFSLPCKYPKQSLSERQGHSLYHFDSSVLIVAWSMGPFKKKGRSWPGTETAKWLESLITNF